MTDEFLAYQESLRGTLWHNDKRYADAAYSKPERTDDPNWRWVELWEQENPHPGQEGFRTWWAEREKVHDRVWVAWCLPQFEVWDWSDEDVALARRLVARHVCGVCGAPDDDGCVVGC